MEQREYVRRLLEAYRATPGTCGVVRLDIENRGLGRGAGEQQQDRQRDRAVREFTM